MVLDILVYWEMQFEISHCCLQNLVVKFLVEAIQTRMEKIAGVNTP